MMQRCGVRRSSNRSSGTGGLGVKVEHLLPDEVLKDLLVERELLKVEHKVRGGDRLALGIVQSLEVGVRERLLYRASLARIEGQHAAHEVDGERIGVR